MKKATTRKPAAKKTETVKKEDLEKMFTIEKNPPPLPVAANEAKAAALNRLRTIAAECPEDGAIIIPVKFRHSGMRLLNKEFEEVRWRVFDIKDNPDFIRIYKKKHLTKKG